MAKYGYGSNYGKIKRLYPTTGRTYFSLKDGKTEMNPNKGYYFIPSAHNNYNVLVSALYMAAENRYTLYARTKQDLVGGYAEVIYLVIDW